MEGIKFYRYSEERKKWLSIKKRKEFFEECNWICDNCLEKKEYPDLSIEHDYPCILGGKNVKVICHKCHQPKTQFDSNIIYFFKKMNFICTNSYETTFFIPENELKEIYYKCRRLKLVGFKT